MAWMEASESMSGRILNHALPKDGTFWVRGRIKTL